MQLDSQEVRSGAHLVVVVGQSLPSRTSNDDIERPVLIEIANGDAAPFEIVVDAQCVAAFDEALADPLSAIKPS